MENFTIKERGKYELRRASTGTSTGEEKTLLSTISPYLYNYLSQCLCVVCVRRERGNSEERIQIRRKLKKIEEEEEEKRKEEGVSLSVAKNVTVR